ncbi:O-antigen ligase family protein [Halomonas sp. GXIMD04776]|uniref:O-antigen ligase family protein n=1 Tax=Halomonas sp. GXIMD04776 TaxID=3415605 RepID=UPI003CAC7366
MHGYKTSSHVKWLNIFWSTSTLAAISRINVRKNQSNRTVNSMISSINLDGWRQKNYWLGWLAISIYAFFWLIDLDISRAGESLFILCFVIAWFSEPDKHLKRHKIFILLLVFLGLQIGVYFFAAERFPEFSDSQVKAGRHMAKLFLCIAIAWWLKGSTRSVLYLLVVLCAGFFASLVFNSSILDWQLGLKGYRVDFSYKNAQHTSVYFGLSLFLGFFWLLHSVFIKASYSKTVLALIITVVSIIGVIITQTRAVWLAIPVTLFCVAIIVIYTSFKSGRFKLSKAKMTAILLGFMVAAGLGAVAFKPFIEKRFEEEERQVISSAIQGNMDDISYSSIGNRLHTWTYALEKIGERPLTGWGPQSRKPLIDEGPFPDWIKDMYGHFHNSYIEIALAYGLIGVLIFAVLTFCIIRGIVKLSKAKHDFLFLGLLSAFVFFAIVNFFESYLIFRTGMYFYILLGGMGLTFYLFDVDARDKRIS